MKSTRYMALVAGLALTVSCSDLLDTAPEGGTVTDGQKQEVVDNDPSKTEAGVNGIFAQFSTYMPNSDVWGEQHNDIGYPGIMLRLDVDGFDVVGGTNGYNWFNQQVTYADRVYTTAASSIIWSTLYQQIYTSNQVIGALDPEAEDSQSQFFLAQGLATRAFNYWVLAQIYQFTYAGHEDSPCVPLITEENAGTVAVEGAPRATVAEVYEQICSDLDTAIELLEKTSTKPADKRYVSKAVAYGLRARVNLTMQKWADAAADADMAIASFSGRPYTIDECFDPTLTTSFWNQNDAPIMWAIVIDVSDRVVTSGIVNWPSHLHSLCYGYNGYNGGFQINKALFETIPESDVRRGWWLDADGYSAHIASNSAAVDYLDGNGMPPYTNVKFGPDQGVVGTSDNANDVPMMRVEEMYLIKAEGLAMSGQVAAGREVLENLIKTYRDKSYACKASDAESLQDEIFRQRRIELWGEGLVWFDIMRLEKDMDRRDAGYGLSVTYNIPAGSPLLLYRLPQGEITANPQISEGDNNPVDSPANYRVFSDDEGDDEGDEGDDAEDDEE